ncbi:MAG TPA: RNA-binding S4 domain-containing protein [Candidatus Omnitrophota bacterium]|nr:RNA-binding S4 domain-containing protein [Candidatus Omnitrophota bacterium]HPS36101.1 RNA-binding S4 domain-containing protein [Candidatus Omnitrophota bacterium]
MAETSFILQGEFIELNKLLKVCGLCESGGMAKQAIAQGCVKVDGQIELRKAFKVRQGMRVEYAGHTIVVG